MFWQKCLGFILVIMILCISQPALADWTHPLSFSNAELSRR
ncbi:MAG: pentapeptide repeat-containing protein, partial [Dolichospermum sp.]